MIRRVIQCLDAWFDAVMQRAGDDVLHVAGIIALGGLLIVARVAIAQTDLQRQIDKLERDLTTTQREMREDARRAAERAQGGFERLAAVERSVLIITQSVSRLETLIYGLLATLIGNFLLSLKTTADVRALTRANGGEKA